jgi:hypothetical protein
MKQQNLSEWRQGGSREWRIRRELIGHAGELSASCGDLEEEVETPLLAGDLLTMVFRRRKWSCRREKSRPENRAVKPSPTESHKENDTEGNEENEGIRIRIRIRITRSYPKVGPFSTRSNPVKPSQTKRGGLTRES